MMEMDQELAKKLFIEGATLVILDMPQGTEFGIDYNSWTVGPRFKGVKMIPQGFHFVFYSAVSKQNQTAPRTGFLKFFKRAEVLVCGWNKDLEIISFEEVQSDDVKRICDGIMELDSNLGAYPYESLKKWMSLTNHITEDVVTRVQPLSGYVSSVTEVQSEESQATAMDTGTECSSDKPSSPQASSQLKQKPEAMLRFLSVVKKYPVGSSPSQITKHSMDYSYTLEEILKTLKSEEELLGELQLSFICFLQGQVYDAFEQWKSLVKMLCSCEEAMKTHPSLFHNLISILHFQLKDIPEDFFVDIVSRSNFLTATLQTFFSILEDSKGAIEAALVKKGLRFRDNLHKQFQWDFSSEPDEFAPVVVDTKAL